MAKFKAEISDRVREWKVTFEDKQQMHEAFKIALDEMKSRDTNIIEVSKGILCEYAGKILFDDSHSLFVICAEAEFDGLADRWEEEI